MNSSFVSVFVQVATESNWCERYDFYLDILVSSLNFNYAMQLSSAIWILALISAAIPYYCQGHYYLESFLVLAKALPATILSLACIQPIKWLQGIWVPNPLKNMFFFCYFLFCLQPERTFIKGICLPLSGVSLAWFYSTINRVTVRDGCTPDTIKWAASTNFTWCCPVHSCFQIQLISWIVFFYEGR